MNVGKAKGIFDNCFNGVKWPALIRDNDCETDEIAMAIYQVANMATHNSTNKESLCTAILWLFENYKLEQIKEQKKEVTDIIIYGRMKASSEPRTKGYWGTDRKQLYGFNTYTCSVCGEPFSLTYGSPKANRYNFCPNCGADMRE